MQMTCKQFICDSNRPWALVFPIPYGKLAYNTHTIWTSDRREVTRVINNMWGGLTKTYRNKKGWYEVDNTYMQAFHDIR